MISVFLAQQAPAGPMSVLGSLVPMVLVLGVMYVLVIRPQQKQQRLHKQMVDSARAGDKVVTTGGLHGKVTNVDKDIVQIEVAKGVEVQIDKSSIQNIHGYKQVA